MNIDNFNEPMSINYTVGLNEEVKKIIIETSSKNEVLLPLLNFIIKQLDRKHKPAVKISFQRNRRRYENYPARRIQSQTLKID